MEIRYLPGQRFQCLRSARCCRGPWDVSVEPDRADEIRRCGFRPEGRDGPLFQERGSRLFVARSQGGCVFLGADRLCALQGSLGMEAKPLACRDFPFVTRRTPTGIRVGASFFCSSVRENSGLPLAEHGAAIQEIASAGRAPSLGFDGVVVDGERRLSWKEYLGWEASLLEGLDGGPIRPILGAALQGAFEGLPDPSAALPAEEFRFTPDLAAAESYFGCALVGLLETPRGQDPKPLVQALFMGEEVEVARWTGTAALAAERPVGAWLEEETVRFLRALVFRGFPAERRTLARNLALLYLLPGVLRFYTVVHSLARKAGAPERRDYYDALEAAEVYLTTHSRGLDPLVEAITEGLRRYLAGA